MGMDLPSLHIRRPYTQSISNVRAELDEYVLLNWPQLWIYQAHVALTGGITLLIVFGTGYIILSLSPVDTFRLFIWISLGISYIIFLFNWIYRIMKVPRIYNMIEYRNTPLTSWLITCFIILNIGPMIIIYNFISITDIFSLLLLLFSTVFLLFFVKWGLMLDRNNDVMIGAGFFLFSVFYIGVMLIYSNSNILIYFHSDTMLGISLISVILFLGMISIVATLVRIVRCFYIQKRSFWDDGLFCWFYLGIPAFSLLSTFDIIESSETPSPIVVYVVIGTILWADVVGWVAAWFSLLPRTER